MKKLKLIYSMLISLVLLSCSTEKDTPTNVNQNPCGNVTSFTVSQNKGNIDFNITTDKPGPYEISIIPLGSSDPENGDKKFFSSEKIFSKIIGQDLFLGTTGYSFFVRNICSSTSKSDWGLEKNITINDDFCFTPKNIQISSPIYNTISWTVNDDYGVAPSNYQVQYGPEGFTPVDSGTPANGIRLVTTVGMQFDATMLINTAYDIYVRSYCSSTNTSKWIGPKNYICVYSTNQCIAPTYANHTLVSATSSTFTPNITWESDATSQYEVALLNSEGIPTQSQLTVVNAPNSATYSNLQRNYTYYFYVRKICTGNTRTAFFGPHLVSY